MMPTKPVVPTKPMMPTKPMVPTKPMMAAKPVGAPSGVPAPYAGHEQHCQHHDDPYPLGWSASALISRPHRASLPRLRACVPWKTPLLTTWRDSSPDRRARGSGPHRAVGACYPQVTVFPPRLLPGPAVVIARGACRQSQRRCGASAQRHSYAKSEGDRTSLAAFRVYHASGVLYL